VTLPEATAPAVFFHPTTEARGAGAGVGSIR
jgi:hypothetical protein